MASYPGSMDVGGAEKDVILRPIAFEVEIFESPSTPCVPKRVRRRLLESPESRSKPPSSIEEIEAKLKEADQRRQQFHEWLANKARPKAKSPTHSRPPEDLAERLHTKLVAAEQKRLELLAQEQMRLARVKEVRAAARTEVQLRAEREREQLESRVESRGLQAETNRLALLEAERQKRALVHERVAQSILQRTTQEGKDKERIEALRALICQKLAAADEKRECLLEAEKKRAQAVVLQARKVAKAVRKKRELESRHKKEFLEARLQSAKRRRAEYLGQRGGCQGASHHNGHKMKKYGDQLCRKLTRCWRQFRRSRRTTLMLAQDFAACDINYQAVVSLPFDELAARITPPATLRVVKALLARIESRFMLSSASGSDVAQLDHLLKRLYPPAIKPSSGHGGARMGQKGVHRQNLARNSTKESGSKGAQNVANAKSGAAQKATEKNMDRYPVRVFLCAYMILGHPEAVFSGRGEREVRLSEAALKLIPEFEALVSTILVGPQSSHPSSPGSNDGEKAKNPAATRPFPVLLADFDAAWCSYLYHFVVWKVPDARSLEDDMIRMACRFETAMLGVMSEDNGGELNHDNQAIKEQVLTDQRGLRERILQLTGSAGISRMETALVEARRQFSEARENRTLLASPFASPRKSSKAASSSSSPPPMPTAGALELEPKSEMVNVSKFLLSSFNGTESAAEPTNQKAFDNEKVVNDMLHEPSGKILEMAHGTDKATSIKLVEIQIKKTMEDAFWDGVLEGLNRDPPDYKRIVGLLEEVKLELESLVPDAWKQELHECMDMEIFAQVLESGSHDYEYLHKLLDSALSIVLKMGAPARDEDVRASHNRMIEELAQSASKQSSSRSSFALSLVKGLRFILQQIQVLKADISAARIQALTPILQGSAGVEYLQKAFSKRYMLPGVPSYDADWQSMLPRTSEWLREAQLASQQDEEQLESLRASNRPSVCETGVSVHGIPPSMRTGGRVMVTNAIASSSSSSPVLANEHRAIDWRSVRTLVPLGILKLVSGVTPVTEESVPETMVLNAQRLRSAQNEYQRILVLATGLLLLRQNMAARRVMAGADLNRALKLGKEQLEQVLDDPEVSVSRIGAVLANVAADGPCSPDDQEMMTRLLNRSLSPEDTIFRCISTAIQSALRTVMLLGKGPEGISLVSASLQRAGASELRELVVDLGVKLERLASISCSIHGPVYSAIVGPNH